MATRETARLVFRDAIDKNYHSISLKDIKSTSRSFLDELFVLAERNNTSIVDVPRNLQPLYDLIKKSHEENKVYAPVLRIRESQTLHI